MLDFWFHQSQVQNGTDLHICHIVPSTGFALHKYFSIHLLGKKLEKNPIHNSFRLDLIKELMDLCNANFNLKNKKLRKTLEDEKSFHAHGLAEKKYWISGYIVISNLQIWLLFYQNSNYFFTNLGKIILIFLCMWKKYQDSPKLSWECWKNHKIWSKTTIPTHSNKNCIALAHKGV